MSVAEVAVPRLVRVARGLRGMAVRPETLILVGVALVIGYLALVPLGYLLWGTFFDDQGFTLRFFEEAYTRGDLSAQVVVNSLVFATGSTVLAVVLGTTLAYLNARTDVPLRRLIFAAAMVPLVIPGILHAVAWILLLSPRIGLINNALQPVLGPGTFDIFSMYGMILVEGLHLSPLVFLLMVAAFRAMDPSLEESAVMSGASLGGVVRRVTLPMVKPALVAAVLVMLVRSLESFEVPALLGPTRGIWVFTSRIWRALNLFPPRFGVAGALAMPLLLLTSVGVYLQSRLSGRGRAFQTVTGKGFRPHPMPLGRWKAPALALVLVYLFFAVLLPMFVLVYASTQPYYAIPSAETLSNMTLDNYRYTFTQSESLHALRNSFLLGIGSATVVMFVMALASWLVVRSRVRGRWMLDNLAFLPLVVPGLVLGVSLLFVYLRFPLPIYGTLWILLIAYCTRYMPYGMRYATISMHQIGGELEESARTSGASWWQTFRRVNLPLLMPGLIAGWLYIVTVSIRELSSSILLYSPGNEVLSILIWERWTNGQFTELSALGVVMVASTVAVIVVANRVGARMGIREFR
jgi:iron(III) transport system permease protein